MINYSIFTKRLWAVFSQSAVIGKFAEPNKIDKIMENRTNCILTL
jgi:hypothetical protein